MNTKAIVFVQPCTVMCNSCVGTKCRARHTRMATTST